jgi:hypothetical protein
VSRKFRIRTVLIAYITVYVCCDFWSYSTNLDSNRVKAFIIICQCVAVPSTIILRSSTSKIGAFKAKLEVSLKIVFGIETKTCIIRTISRCYNRFLCDQAYFGCRAFAPPASAGVYINIELFPAIKLLCLSAKMVRYSYYYY